MWRRGHEGTPVGRDQLICHSDAGSQYTSLCFTEHLHIEGIQPSIGSVGDAYDNALMETINGLYKVECIRTKVFHDGPYRTISDVSPVHPATQDGRGSLSFFERATDRVTVREAQRARPRAVDRDV